MQNPGGLKGEGTERGPGQTRVPQLQGNVHQGGSQRQKREESGGTALRTGQQLSKLLRPPLRNREKQRGDAIENQQNPDKPGRTGGPIAERKPLAHKPAETG